MTDTTDNPNDMPEKSLPPMPPAQDIHAKRTDKSSYFYGNVAVKLNLAKRATDGIINNPVIQDYMSVYGYSQEKIQSFKNSYLEAVAANSKQQKEHGDKTGAYADFEKAFTSAKEEYEIISKLTKLALKHNTQKIDQLGLSQKKKRDIAGIFNAMQKFYDNAIGDDVITSALAVYAFDERKIANFRDGFISARDAHNIYYKENSEAVEATRVRDQKMEVLDEWMTEFYTVSKIALAHKPELMTQISVC